MWVEKLAWPSLNANRAQIYGKISRITLWAFERRLGRGISPNFQPQWVSLRLPTLQSLFSWYACSVSPNIKQIHIKAEIPATIKYFKYILETITNNTDRRNQTGWEGLSGALTQDPSLHFWLQVFLSFEPWKSFCISIKSLFTTYIYVYRIFSNELKIFYCLHKYKWTRYKLTILVSILLLSNPTQ